MDGVNQQPRWRLPRYVGALRPCGEGMVWRPFEWKHGKAVDRIGEDLDHSARPSVNRVGSAILEFFGLLEDRPESICVRREQCNGFEPVIKAVSFSQRGNTTDE